MKRLIALLMTASVLVYVGGCASIPVAQTRDCFGFSAIRPLDRDVDVVSNHLARQILKHDLHGANICGWKP